ncbi:MAG: glycosyltransferase [Candidatus Eisenbacteria bacterium]
MTARAREPVIAILSWNKVDLLKRCLESVFELTKHPCRVCVVDQASTDGTKNYLEKLGDRIDRISPEENLGFVRGNNRVMERYGDRDMVLLNNDTVVTEGWLGALVERAESDGKIGVVGGKLVYPDGRLQAAGCEIYSDASGREIGKHDDPDRWIYNQAADVDYVSGACLYVKRETLERTGYFDLRFAPAYWEDTDLCFSARKAGFRVVYEPRSIVVHHEGGSFGGPGTRSVSSELQARNKPKFVAKWAKELTKQRENVYEIPRAPGKEKILVILPFLPVYDKAAGEMRWFHTLKILAERYQVVFLARNGRDGVRYINPLEEWGVTVFHTDTEKLRALGFEGVGPVWIDFPELLRMNDFRAVIVGFYHMAAQYHKEIREHSPESLLVIDSYDVAFLRERRKAEVTGKDEDFWRAEETRRIELSWYRKADMVLTVTEQDREVLLAEDRSLRVGISTDIHPVPPFEWSGERKDLVFIGNYNHQPNEDAVVHFVNHVLPLVHEKLPDVRFHIVGNNPTPAVSALAGKRVNVTGYVPDILPWLRECRVCVVPLRYGAGLKGKVGQAMAAGIPQVSTRIGAEGMGLSHGRDILIADGSEAFAAEVVRLYQDEDLQKRIASNARELAAERYSAENAARYWEEVFEAIGRGRRAEKGTETPGGGDYRRLERRPAMVPKAGIVIPVWNNLRLTVNCWTSIRKNTKTPFDLVIVDNGSTEPVAYDAEQNNFRVIRNEKNLGFAAAVNQGIRAVWSDYVVILNNDCIVTPGWLERMIAHLEEDPSIGVVAPQTNYASTGQRVAAEYRDETGLYKFSDRLYRKNRGRREEMNKVVGMCMVLPRRVIEEVGLFDERFGIGNFEDDDYCLRIRMAGYKVVCARDVYVHHEGGATFRLMDVDYKALLEENSKVYLRKWSFLGAPGAVRPAPAEGASSLTVLLYQDGREVSGGRIRETLRALPPGTNGRILSEEPSKFRPFRAEGIPVQGVPRGDLWKRLDREIRSASTPWVLLLSSRVRAPAGFVETLAAAAAGRERAAVVSPRANEGPPARTVHPDYASPKRGLDDFASRLREENRDAFTETADQDGAVLLIRKDAYVESGGFQTEFRSGAGWVDLAARMADRRWESGIAPGAYVHLCPAREGVSEWEPKEREAVRFLVESNRLHVEGNGPAALERVEESLRRKPDYAYALYWRALLLAGEGRMREAEDDLRTALESNPRFVPARNSLGCFAFEQGNAVEAEEHFRRALADEPGSADVARNLGDLFFSVGRVEEALRVYRDIVRRTPDDPSVYVDLGGWYERLGDQGGAAEWYRQALEKSPDHEEAKKRLAALEEAAVGATRDGRE